MYFLISSYFFFYFSTGVGRPGVFIALRYLQEESEVEGYVNIFQAVQKLKQQRASLIQTRVRQKINFNKIQMSRGYLFKFKTCFPFIFLFIFSFFGVTLFLPMYTWSLLVQVSYRRSKALNSKILGYVS